MVVFRKCLKKLVEPAHLIIRENFGRTRKFKKRYELLGKLQFQLGPFFKVLRIRGNSE